MSARKFRDLESWDGYVKADKYVEGTLRLAAEIMDMMKRSFEAEQAMGKSLAGVGGLNKKKKTDLEAGELGSLGILYAEFADKLVDYGTLYSQKAQVLIDTILKSFRSLVADKDKQRKNLMNKTVHHQNGTLKAQKDQQKAEASFQKLKADTEAPAFIEKPNPKTLEKMHQADAERRRLQEVYLKKVEEFEKQILPAALDECQSICEAFYSELHDLMTSYVDKYRESGDDLESHFNSLELGFAKLERSDIDEFVDQAQCGLAEEKKKNEEAEKQKILDAEREAQRQKEREERQREKERKQKEKEERLKERQREREEKQKERERILKERREKDLARKLEEDERRARIREEEIKAQEEEEARRAKLAGDEPPPAFSE